MPAIPENREGSIATLAARGAVGGALMGVANLVPGISGGTMLLATGVYPRFIAAVAEVSTLKFRRRSLVTLGTVIGAALISIVLLAGLIKGVVVEHRWLAYSVFVGLTLGGVPLVHRLIRRYSVSVWISAAVGVAFMATLAIFQMLGSGADASNGGFLLMVLAGVAGASAMILPGISGGYLLLVLGVYVPILSGIDEAKLAVKGGSLGELWGPLASVVLPVGLGVVVGVVVVSNLLRWLLARFEQPTLGALLGLLVGAVFGLWPFQRGVAPEVGAHFKGEIVTAERLTTIKPQDYPTEFFAPSVAEILTAVAFVVAGLLLTQVIARIGRGADASTPEISD